MNRFSKIVLHSVFQFVTIVTGGSLFVFGLGALIMEYILSGCVLECVAQCILPLPIIGVSIILLDIILLIIAKHYDKKTKVRKTEDCEGNKNSAPYNYDMSSSCVYGDSSGYIKSQSSASGTFTVSLDKDARLVPNVTTGKYFIEYRNVKIAEVDNNGKLLTVLVPELYEEYIK